jgi:hypothetical protein
VRRRRRLRVPRPPCLPYRPCSRRRRPRPRRQSDRRHPPVPARPRRPPWRPSPPHPRCLFLSANRYPLTANTSCIPLHVPLPPCPLAP